MVRSWAYILMIAATLAGVVALVWPSPRVQTIEEISMPARNAPPPRAEAPAKPAKAAKTPPSAKREPPAPAPAAVVKKMPAPNTTTKRQFAQPENGMQPSPFNRLGQDGAKPAPPGLHNAPPRPSMPPRPGSPPGQPARPPAAK